MLRIAVIGASGFTGVELVKLLKKHPMQEKMDLYSFSKAGKKIKDFSDQLIDCEDILKDFSKIVYDDYDLVFFACPNGTAMNEYSDLNKSNVRMIDLAADYRLDDDKIWEEYYKIKHKSPEILSKTTYGLTEINRNKIKDAKIVANPGCYPTAAILSLYPLLKNNLIKEDRIIIDAKSGYSGAGREKIESGLSEKIKDNFIPYNFYNHRHFPEITQELNKAANNNVEIIFSPHILPIYRGILETIYVDLKKDFCHKDIIEIYKDFYKEENFIKINESGFTNISDVVNTNNINLSFHLGKNNKLTIVAAIDNLLKGAAGQAIQNMNVMFGYDELTALINE